MALNDDTNISALLSDVKNLFQGKPSASLTPSNSGIVGGKYQAPIKASWKSSGGFALNVKRPNGSTSHLGVDLRAPGGTEIYPLAPGVVTNVGTDPKGGNVVNIQHANGVRSYYAHMSTAKVQKGQSVDNNTVIGTVGDTGNAKGTYPHLHFQVWQNDQIQDPAKYFSVPPYSNLDQKEIASKWVSDKARQEAQSFDMKAHTSKQRVAFSRDVERLLTVAKEFYKLAQKA
jgi:murein DD-endopeptidase MepM/ murein hydrolase activator NlpD